MAGECGTLRQADSEDDPVGPGGHDKVIQVIVGWVVFVGVWSQKIDTRFTW